MNIIGKILSRLDVSELKFTKIGKVKTEQKPSLLKEVIDTPEQFKLEAFIEGDEIIVKIKKREKES